MKKLSAIVVFLFCLIGGKSAFGQPCDFYGITHGNGFFVAVGCNGQIYNSADGVTWNAVTYSQTDNTLNAVAYGGGMFVAVGNGGWTAISSDGANWTSLSSGVTVEPLATVTYGNGQFVAGGRSGTFITSAKGQDWTTEPLSTIDTSDFITAMVYTNGVFVAAGSDGGVSYTSPDGVNWTQGGNGLNGNYFTSLTSGNGTFVAANSSGQIYDSFDGLNWRETADTSVSISCLSYGDGIFVAGANSQVSYSSPDGTNWTAVHSPAGSVVGNSIPNYALTFSGGSFYFVGQNGDIASGTAASLTPPALTTWTVSSYDNTAFDTNDYLTSVVFGADQFVAIGSDYNTAFESLGGTDWNQESNTLSGDYFTSVAYGNGIYVAVNSSGQINVLTNDFTAPSAATWTQTASAAADLQAVCFGNGEFVAVGDDDFGPVAFTSTDGAVWTEVNVPGSGQLRAVLYDGARFIAVGAGTTAAFSPDGSSWTLANLPSAEPLSGIAQGDGLYVAVGADGTLITSPDAVTWSAPSNYITTPNSLNGVVFNGGLFIATGNNGWMVTSIDGTNWISHNSATVNNLSGGAYGNGSFVLVGANGTILTVNQLPILLSQPPANIYLTNGGGTTLTASVGGSGPFTYHWQVGGVNLANNANIAGVSSPVLVLTNVDSTFSGQYTLVINNGYGALTTRVVNVNVGFSPTIFSMPDSQSSICGIARAFEISSFGTLPLTFTWHKVGGAIIHGQIETDDYTSTLAFANVVPTNGGSYYITVSNPYGHVQTPAFTLTTTLEKTLPTVHITSPVAKKRASSITMSGTASDSIAVGGVHYTIADEYSNVLAHGSATLSVPGAKSITWTVPALPIAGSNVLTVVVTNFSGLSATSSVAFFNIEQAPLNVLVEQGGPEGKITGRSFFKDTAPAVGQTLLNVGETYQLTATANTNWHFTGWMIQGNVVENSNVFDFVMQKDLVISTGFATNNFSDFAGLYFGDFYVTTNNADLVPDKAGFICIGLKSDGTYTGEIKIYGEEIAQGFNGAFDASAGSSTNVVVGDTVILRVDYQSLGGNQVRQIYASVIGNASGGNSWAATGQLILSGEDGIRGPVSEGEGDFPTHAFLLHVPPNSQISAPLGFGGGYFRLVESSTYNPVSKKFTSTKVGSFDISEASPENFGDFTSFYFGPEAAALSDVTPVSTKNMLVGADGALPIMVIGNGSAIVGRLTLPTSYPNRDQLATNFGALTWIVAPGVDPFYPNGFVAPLDVIVDKAFSPTENLTVPTFATVTLSGGGLTNTLTGTVKIANTVNQRTSLNWLTPEASGHFVLDGAYSPTNGQFSVKFTNAATGTVIATGQMLTGPAGQYLGAGSFVGPTNDGVITITPN